MGEVILKVELSEEEYEVYRKLDEEERVKYIRDRGKEENTVDFNDISYVFEERLKE